MCAIAIVVIQLFHPKPFLPALLAGFPLMQQAVLGLALGGLYFLVGVVGQKYIAQKEMSQTVVESYSRLDLSGWNPLWIALAAGFGEELLFRGALQPVVGIWGASALFMLAHVKAYRFNRFDKRVLVQGFGLFAASVGLGYIAHFAGLLTAMIIHAAVDIAGLYAIRRMAQTSATVA